MSRKPRARHGPAPGEHKRDLVLGMPGQPTPVAVRLSALRAAFLSVLQDAVPEVLDTLAVSTAGVSADARDGVLGAWARRWNLLDITEAPSLWVIDAARETVALWEQWPTTKGRAWALPSGGAWWLDAPDVPVLRGSTATRSLRPLRWLALRLCGGLTPGDIAGAEFGHNRARIEIKAIEVENMRQARALGLRIPPRPRGRPGRSSRA